MIEQVKTSKGSDAITSDQWHVVRSRYQAAPTGFRWSRLVESEHATRALCVAAARELQQRIVAEAEARPAAERDEVFVRRPGFKSLESTRRRRAKSRRRG